MLTPLRLLWPHVCRCSRQGPRSNSCRGWVVLTAAHGRGQDPACSLRFPRPAAFALGLCHAAFGLGLCDAAFGPGPLPSGLRAWAFATRPSAWSFRRGPRPASSPGLAAGPSSSAFAPLGLRPRPSRRRAFVLGLRAAGPSPCPRRRVLPLSLRPRALPSGSAFGPAAGGAAPGSSCGRRCGALTCAIFDLWRDVE
jgi:hypothetical protein